MAQSVWLESLFPFHRPHPNQPQPTRNFKQKVRLSPSWPGGSWSSIAPHTKHLISVRCSISIMPEERRHPSSHSSLGGTGVSPTLSSTFPDGQIRHLPLNSLVRFCELNSEWVPNKHCNIQCPVLLMNMATLKAVSSHHLPGWNFILNVLRNILMHKV